MCYISLKIIVFGYLGSHVSAWPEFRQLHGLFGTPSANPLPYIRLVHRRTRSAAYTRSTANTAGNPRRRALPRLPLGQGEDGMVVMDRLSAYETGLLADLSGDVGVSLWEWDGLFERCDRCGRYFVARVLRIHIPHYRG
ncbi:hypothetical protein K503DRAFT_619049 [Rhizopogon vinicolor AM-OR11-026]|uniref:Uncharacterized protein n=1 Tax=Rhizopogon vinicolor AM-OR11-026 TaxID=1314800 RepID=A0A1B7MIC0_9AGAM|nr:hypothetical protein K503DRAFT_619049 [Rhizopogon vinicolor AM-OR11-026]